MCVHAGVLGAVFWNDEWNHTITWCLTELSPWSLRHQHIQSADSSLIDRSSHRVSHIQSKVVRLEFSIKCTSSGISHLLCIANCVYPICHTTASLFSANTLSGCDIWFVLLLLVFLNWQRWMQKCCQRSKQFYWAGLLLAVWPLSTH